MKKTQMDLNPEDPNKPKSVKEANPLVDAKQEAKSASPPEEAEKERSPQRIGKKRLLLLGGAGLFVLCGAVGVGSYLGWVKIPGISAPKNSAPPPAQRIDIGPMIKLAPLVINLNEESGRHFIKTTLVLEIAKGEAAEEVKSKLPSLTDMAILALGDKKLEDFRNPDVKENLKRELLEKANRVVSQGKITGIYFDEFLFQ